MNIKNLQKILSGKEQRAMRQREFLTACDCLVSFSLNIPGPVKKSALYDPLFQEGTDRLAQALGNFPGIRITGISAESDDAGYLCLIRIKGNGESPEETAVSVKKVTLAVETETPEGRLFDMDVLFPGNGGDPQKISRSRFELPRRRCLLCEKDAFICARSLNHRAAEILIHIVDLILDSESVWQRIYGGLPGFPEKCAKTALRALLLEVITTPKPGLVDADNSGAHRDMDISTFFDSAVALVPYFGECVQKGMELAGKDPAGILPELRPLGLAAEKRMYEATEGINTHKGAVFTFGIVLCALGMLFKEERLPAAEEVLKLSGEICASMENGSRGIRYEAMNGYPDVRETGLPVMRSALCSEKKKETRINEAGVQSLLSLIGCVDDANIERRCGAPAAERARLLVSENETEELIARAARLDGIFIKENMSPGGSADLLALSYFFADLEGRL